MAFTHYTEYVVQSGQVPSAQSDFPVLLNPTANRYRTIGNGGNVQNANGYDIRPYASDGTTPLDFELVPGTYDPTAGSFEMWVKLPTADTGSVIRLYYGDSGISTDGSTTDTWSNGYVVVLHLPDGTTVNSDDSSPEGNHYSQQATPPDATPFRIGGGIECNNTTAHQLFRSSSLSGDFSNGDFTLTAWVVRTTSSQLDRLLDCETGRLVFGSDGSMAASPASFGFYNDTDGWIQLIDGITEDNIFHLGVVLDLGVGSKGFRNGALQTSAAFTGVLTALDGRSAIGDRYDISGSARCNFLLDEFRLSNVARSDDWIESEYNTSIQWDNFVNQGTEQAVGPNLNTAAKRASAINLALPFGRAGIIPSGSNLDSNAERMHVQALYVGIPDSTISELLAAADGDATFDAVVTSFGLVSAAGVAGATLSGIASAIGVFLAGAEADEAGARLMATPQSLSASTDADEIFTAFAATVAALNAGATAGESWSAQAGALAALLAGVSVDVTKSNLAAAIGTLLADTNAGAVFSGASEAAEEAAIEEGSESAATFLAATATLATLTATINAAAVASSVSDATAAINAGAAAGESWAAQVVALGALAAPASAGASFPSMAEAIATLASSANAAATFDGETQDAQQSAMSAGTAASAAFLGAAETLAAVSIAASAAAAFSASLGSGQLLEAAGHAGASFITGAIARSAQMVAGAIAGAVFLGVATAGGVLEAQASVTSVFAYPSDARRIAATILIASRIAGSAEMEPRVADVVGELGPAALGQPSLSDQ